MASTSGQVTAIHSYRRFFAEEIQACAGIRNQAIVDAFAAVPRERFLGPGPWVMKSEADLGGPPRQTPDGDPRRVYHNVALAIDPARQLFNGQPSTLGVWIDALDIGAGARILHVGAGLGYYSAILAHVVGPRGRVVAVEVDDGLASRARGNLEAFEWVDLRHGDATATSDERFDAILVNAGATHPLDAWLDALAPGGRLVLPLTVNLPPGGPLGKGFVVLITNDATASSMSVRLLPTMVMIYSGQRIRDEAASAAMGRAFSRGALGGIKRLRRDRHDESPSCCLHADTFCLSSA
jgi:protein-L-isoaspartate(D-aspartate) O-methyltransferase